MLVTSTTDAYADNTMFGDVTLAMLKTMGHSTTVPGAIVAEDVPAALSRITAAVEAEKASQAVEDKDADEPPVNMKNRALPLIDLLGPEAKANTCSPKYRPSSVSPWRHSHSGRDCVRDKFEDEAMSELTRTGHQAGVAVPLEEALILWQR